MNRLLSVLFSFFAQLLPYIRFSNRKGFASMLLIVVSNSVPVLGVIFFKWNPFIILVIYWAESAVIGFFNILKMFIGGIIQDNRFSPVGTAKAVFFCLFFTFHYGGFMLGHGIFITAMLSLAGNSSSSNEFNPFGLLFSLLPSSSTLNGFLQSQLFAIAVLFVNHFISFYISFIRTGEYNITEPEDYMTQPYKRIFVMHLTLILGFFVLLISGMRGAYVIIVWVAMKVIADLKMNISEENIRKGRK